MRGIYYPSHCHFLLIASFDCLYCNRWALQQRKQERKQFLEQQGAFPVHANGKGGEIGIKAGLNRPAHFRTGFLWGACHSAMLRQHWRHVTTWRFWWGED